ncbi:hypothetical protein PHLCEN_2v13666 [Hermanssonia centrifuga]|uniref:Uncharacterized protein n=1 Tax=Hermanssonia centrifuga TaxID=98765 RepID=A0A2R6NDJ6_9APHY|nr:hypothetical protein PHLCEN_2v13666 [Hermanssonia centrifuga]
MDAEMDDKEETGTEDATEVATLKTVLELSSETEVNALLATEVRRLELTTEGSALELAAEGRTLELATEGRRLEEALAVGTGKRVDGITVLSEAIELEGTAETEHAASRT